MHSTQNKGCQIKSGFESFYSSTQAPPSKEHWTKSIIVPDANFLLNLYKLPQEGRKTVFELLEKIKDRLFLPHQVVLEFHNNRNKVIADEILFTENAKNQSDAAINSAIGAIRKLRVDDRDLASKEAALVDQLKETQSALRKTFDAVKAGQNIDLDNDPIRIKFEAIFAGKIGPPFSQKILDEIYEEGEIRYSYKTPPGFLDADKNQKITHDGLRIYKKFGDLIVWRQVLEFAKKSDRKNLIFLSDENGADFLAPGASDPTLPHPELLLEAARLSGIELFWIFKLKTFTTIGSALEEVPVSPDSERQIATLSDQPGINANIPVPAGYVSTLAWDWVNDSLKGRARPLVTEGRHSHWIWLDIDLFGAVIFVVLDYINLSAEENAMRFLELKGSLENHLYDSFCHFWLLIVAPPDEDVSKFNALPWKKFGIENVVVGTIASGRFEPQHQKSELVSPGNYNKMFNLSHYLKGSPDL